MAEYGQPELVEPEYTDEVAEPEESKGLLHDNLEAGNLVEQLDDNQNTELSAKTLDLLNEADQSMEKWLKKYKRALMLARLQPTANGTEIEEKDFPFKGASLAMMPYITEAMIDFNARSAPEMVWAKDIAKVTVYGANNDEKEARAERVADYQNYQLSEKIPSWRKNQDKALFCIPCTGTYYKETYYCPDISGTRSDLCFADDIIFDHSYPTFEEAPHKFKKVEYTKNEVIGFIRGEAQWNLEESSLEDDKETFTFVEAYTLYDLDDDGLSEPYICIIDDKTSKIVYMVPYYDEESIDTNEANQIISITPLDRFTQVQFLPDPEGGPMGMGWGILLGPMFEAINTNVRQLIDAGTLSNVAANSGFISADTSSGRGNSIKSGPVEAKLGQLTPIQTRGTNSLRDSIVQFPSAGPNQTLMKLMEYQIEAARRMTSAQSAAEGHAGEAATLYLARLQQSLKAPNSIMMRVFHGCKIEQQKIALINFKHFDDKAYNKVIDSEQQASMEFDFDPDDCDISLVSDPTQGSDIERAARAEAILQKAETDQSGTLNIRAAYINWLEAMNTPNIDELAPEQDPNAIDPTQQLIAAQQAAEMELKKKDQELREGELEVKMMKAARDAAAEMTKLGLQGDKIESEITMNYVKALEVLQNMGIAQGQDALNTIKTIEDTFINAEGGTTNAGRTAIPASNEGSV